MFNIHSITLVNFRSYKGTHEFEFPSAFGLYYFTGRNVLEPALGANGAGKSTFLDAITWCLYGRTTRGLKANEVLSWHGGTSAQVIIDLTIGNQRFKIKRTQKPNTLLLDDKPLDQKELETHLRLNYAAFTHSVMSPQFGEPFFSLSPGDKLTLFSDFMNLDFWLTKSEDAAKAVRKLEAELTKLSGTIARTEGQIEVIKGDIKSLKKQETDFEANRAVKVEGLESEISQLKKEIIRCNAAITEMSSDRSTLAADIEHARAEMLFAQKKRDDLVDEVALIRARQRAQKELEAATRSRMAEVAKLSGECPTCEQQVGRQHSRQVVQGYQDRLVDMLEAQAAVSEALAKVTGAIVGAKAKYESKADIVQEIQDEISGMATKIAGKTAETKAAKRCLDDLTVTLDEVQTGVNPYTASLDEKKDTLAILTDRVHEASTMVQGLESSLVGNEFWVKGFKRIRLFIIEQAFQTLEIEVNNSLAQLGMNDWQVTFDVERENKSGGVTKGFVVLIRSPSNKDPVKWENWSGGETQRLQLAGDLGLANLIMQQAGLRNEIEFFDEPSTHLSPEGMMDLADTLHDRAVSERKRIWIVDHAAITNFGAFEGIIIARKDENGSTITISR